MAAAWAVYRDTGYSRLGWLDFWDTLVHIIVPRKRRQQMLESRRSVLDSKGRVGTELTGVADVEQQSLTVKCVAVLCCAVWLGSTSSTIGDAAQSSTWRHEQGGNCTAVCHRSCPYLDILMFTSCIEAACCQGCSAGSWRSFLGGAAVSRH